MTEILHQTANDDRLFRIEGVPDDDADAIYARIMRSTERLDDMEHDPRVARAASEGWEYGLELRGGGSLDESTLHDKARAICGLGTSAIQDSSFRIIVGVLSDGAIVGRGARRKPSDSVTTDV